MKTQRSAYNQEQLETTRLIRDHLQSMPNQEIEALREQAADYLHFRAKVADFFEQHFSASCSQKCYTSSVSACCTREGIITFFADIVINTLVSEPDRIDRMIDMLQRPQKGTRCVYLRPDGCLWELKPIVCEMFLCESVKNEVFPANHEAADQWNAFRQEEKRYKWPDRPVLFDAIEELFLKAGITSPLMYLHNSPGLLRIKKQSRQLG